MRHKTMLKTAALILLLFALIVALFAGCADKKEDAITSYAAFGKPGMKIGVMFDLIEFETLKKDYPDAEIIAYNDSPLAYKDVANGRIDAYVYARREMELAIENGTEGVRLMDENYSENPVAVGVSPKSAIPDLQKKLNEFIAESKADGTLDDMFRRWVSEVSGTMPDIPVAAHPAYHLRVGTTGTVMPYSYYVGAELTGYDIELAYRFAAWLGADVDFRIYDFGGIVPAASAGEIDCIMSNLFKTAEKEKEIPFSDTLFNVEITAMVRDTGDTQPTATDVSDYNGKKIGVLVGPLMEDAAKKYFPDSECLLFNSYPDCVSALLAGKIDGFLGDEPGMISLHAETPEVDYIHETLAENNYAFAFRKNDPESAALCEELNDFLAQSRADGTMEELGQIWLGNDEAKKTVDMSDLTGENGTVRVVTTSTDMPWSYVKNGKNVGYDIDLVVRFCRARGYALELGDMDFAGRIPAVQTGKYDFSTDMNVTPEREEQVLFSSPTANGGIVLAVRASADARGAAKKGGGFLSSVADSFEKTFLRENRWQLFLAEIGTTLLITILSIILGTLLGFAVFMLCRNGNPVANTVTRFCVWLVQGMPAVVLLMILCYVVFGKFAISGTVVSVIGFTLIFGAAVFAMMRAGVGAVDGGQTEAAYGLGYSDRKAFFRIVLPQALPHFLPAYKGEITALIKATAVVGYVAVQDLTKIGDIVRSRTYEAFFPLIAVAVIYFILAAILTFIVNRTVLRIDPRRRPKDVILKGGKDK